MAPPVIYKNNFFVDYENTYYGWQYRANPFARSSQVEPVRGTVGGIHQDLIRMHHGAMWSYWHPDPTPNHLVWRRTTPLGDGGDLSSEAVISGYRTQIAASADPPYLVSWDDLPAPPGGAPGTDPFPFETGPDRNEIPYSRLIETIRIEANFQKAHSVFASLPDPFSAWREWVIANYYGRSTTSGILRDYYDHATEYQSPFSHHAKIYTVLISMLQLTVIMIITSILANMNN